MPDSIPERECNPQGAYTIFCQTLHDHEIIPILDASIVAHFSPLKAVVLFYLCFTCVVYSISHHIPCQHFNLKTKQFDGVKKVPICTFHLQICSLLNSEFSLTFLCSWSFKILKASHVHTICRFSHGLDKFHHSVESFAAKYVFCITLFLCGLLLFLYVLKEFKLAL